MGYKIPKKYDVPTPNTKSPGMRAFYLSDGVANQQIVKQLMTKSKLELAHAIEDERIAGLYYVKLYARKSSKETLIARIFRKYDNVDIIKIFRLKNIELSPSIWRG